MTYDTMTYIYKGELHISWAHEQLSCLWLLANYLLLGLRRLASMRQSATIRLRTLLCNQRHTVVHWGAASNAESTSRRRLLRVRTRAHLCAELTQHPRAAITLHSLLKTHVQPRTSESHTFHSAVPAVLYCTITTT